MEYFSGFSKFLEADDQYVNLVKHQLPTDVSAFMHMPIILPAHYKINGKPLGQPLTLYVCDSSDSGVILCNVPNKAVPFTGNNWDADGQLDVSPGGPTKPVRLRMSIEEFRSILTPEAPPAPEGGGLGPMG